MGEKIPPDIAAMHLTTRYHPELLRSRQKLSIGIDIGSTSSDLVVLDEAEQIIFCDYRRTKGRPIETARAQLDEVFRQIHPANTYFGASTGSGGRLLAKLLDIPFTNEVLAQAAAACFLYPHFQQALVIEMGGQDSKLIYLSQQQGQSKVGDFVLNTVCAAGTGSFLDQQAQRLGIDINSEFGQLALQSKTVPRMAGRCSVFAKSDMIHLQQQATPICDIIAGLCLALVRNLKGNLGRGREFTRPIIFTGGVAANIGVVRALEQVLDLTEEELIVPDKHFFTGAIGAILVAKNRTNHDNNNHFNFKKLDNYLSLRGSVLQHAPRRQSLTRPALPPSESTVHEHLLLAADKPIDAYLGVDVGSLSTNIVVIDQQKRVLSKAYLMTAGCPLEAVRKGLDMVSRKVVGKVNILGVATTGSGRYLTGDFIGADMVINEITAQAAGAAVVNPKVDTIFEIGGQDSKYISLKNGVVVDFEMNHACAAGTGSFLEEQAQRLNININEEFAELAFKSKAPIKLGERCTVFMESDLLNYQQQGASTEDLVSGLSYSIVTNYLNRVVGRRKIGDNVCFQGGTAFNKAVWAAFEEVVGKKICVPSHHEVTGALGAAAIVAKHMTKKAEQQGQVIKSNFKDFENLVTVKYDVETFICEQCPNNCEIKRVQLTDSEPLYYGSRCDRYNQKKKTIKHNSFDAFELRNRKLLEFAGLKESSKPKATNPALNVIEGVKKSKLSTIGIPFALVNWQLLPLFAKFFKALGFEVILSGRTNKKLIHMGVESVTAQLCFPVKVAYGHVAELINKKVDYIFLPSIVSMTASYPQNKHSQLCPYVQSFPYQIKTAFADKLGRTKIVTMPIRLGDGRKLLRRTFADVGKELGISASAVNKAIRTGFAAQTGFEHSLKEKGKEILDKIGPEQKLFVLVSRPYNGCDEGLNLRLPKKLSALGITTIPMDMLDLNKAPLGDKLLHSEVYWTYGQKILRAAEIIKNDQRLFAIYLSNFSCGPDSFLLTLFKDIMDPKPCLQLELDEHSADAGVVTRLEAFLDSLRHYTVAKQCTKQGAQRKKTRPFFRDRTLYIPYMSDCAYSVAACFRAYGQMAEVMPMADESTLLQGRQFTTGKECLPCAITTGDMLKVISKEGFDPNKTAFFMPASSGPCRFGMYSCLHRLVLKYAGAESVPVISPNQNSNFYREFAQSIDTPSTTDFMKSMWTATVGTDLLSKLILRLRPFAQDPACAQKIYKQSIDRWNKAVGKRNSLSRMSRLMKSIADDFATIKLNNTSVKPRIGIVGEIYVRSHPFANMNIISRLEQLGAACDLASLAEWIYYTNFIRTQTARRQGQKYNSFSSGLKNYLQHRIENTLAEPLESRFGKLAEGTTSHIIELARPYIHHSFEGEAILSIGKIIEYYKHGVSGVVNVMPFSCMPSTVVSSQTMRLMDQCDGMPILNLSFDGQEDSTLTTRLEAFVEQARQRRVTSLKPAQLVL